jgi:hypothetical protein
VRHRCQLAPGRVEALLHSVYDQPDTDAVPGAQRRRGVNIQVIGEQPGRPMRDTEPRWRRGEGGGEDSGPIHRPRPTRPLLIAQALRPEEA